jgi:radical SAM protein with 4Fe4S-binding SPASM domain
MTIPETAQLGTTDRIHPDLPVFRLEMGDRTILYTPGQARLATAELAQQVERALAGHSGESLYALELAGELAQLARSATQAWETLATKPFEPECLTLYLSNRCNLACTYCYAMPAQPTLRRRRAHRPGSSDDRFPTLPDETIEAAARLVAHHCAAKGKPLTLVLHGGGEPTLHWSLLQRAWRIGTEVAAENDLRLWSYIATHGVLPEERVRWLAEHFDLIGLSCDGPPDVHNANRPSTSGAKTSNVVERTAQILKSMEADFVVRATITRAAVARQSEILEYLCDRLFARSVLFEPAYDARSTAPSQFQAEDAEIFVAHYLAARRAARARGCELQLSGVRLDEIHGPFCNPLREVLQITPDGTASACFLSVGNGDSVDGALKMGHLDALTGAFVIDRQRVAEQRLHAARIPPRCRECHNVYHCARDCPDVCLLSEEKPPVDQDGFRCRVQKIFARHEILEMAIAHAEPVPAVEREELP